VLTTALSFLIYFYTTFFTFFISLSINACGFLEPTMEVEYVVKYFRILGFSPVVFAYYKILFALVISV